MDHAARWAEEERVLAVREWLGEPMMSKKSEFTDEDWGLIA